MRRLAAVVILLGVVFFAVPAPMAADSVCDWKFLNCLESGAEEGYCQRSYCLCESEGAVESLWCLLLYG